MAEITQVYSRARRNFGRPCAFADAPAEILAVVPRCEHQYVDGFRSASNGFQGDVHWRDEGAALADLWVSPRSSTSTFDACPSTSSSGANTTRAAVRHGGMRHVEGGWPAHVDHAEPEDVARHRKRVTQKDNEAYRAAVPALARVVARSLRQNNTVDVHQHYFEHSGHGGHGGGHANNSAGNVLSESYCPEPLAVHTTTVFRDPWGAASGGAGGGGGGAESPSGVSQLGGSGSKAAAAAAAAAAGGGWQQRRQRPVTSVDWHPDGGATRLAAAYSALGFQDPLCCGGGGGGGGGGGDGMPSYIWDARRPNAPERSLAARGTALTCLRWHPKLTAGGGQLLGGCYNGVVAFFDARARQVGHLVYEYFLVLLLTHDSLLYSFPSSPFCYTCYYVGVLRRARACGRRWCRAGPTRTTTLSRMCSGWRPRRAAALRRSRAMASCAGGTWRSWARGRVSAWT